MTYSSLSSELCASSMAMTRDKVIVDHADCLHESVDNGRPDEFETARDELL
jgi:hypothetical protein